MKSKALMLEGGADVGEWRLRPKDGSSVVVEIHANILPDGQWQAFVRDISAREAQRAERDALFEQMERHRLWLDAVMDSCPWASCCSRPTAGCRPIGMRSRSWG